jgi:hypothetical protein
MFMDESGRLMNVPSVEILRKAMRENKKSYKISNGLS